MTEIQTDTLIIHTIDSLGGGTTLRSILDTAAGILTESVDVDLDINDLTAQQQRDTAEALNAISGILRANAGYFRQAAKSNFY